MLRCNGADVAFVSATGGKYQTYRRVPQKNGNSCVRTVQQPTHDQLPNSNDWNRNRPAFVKTEIQKRVTGQTGESIVKYKNGKMVLDVLK
jgi:hypothetical protein